MNIAGLDKCSLVDWPGKVVAVCFTQGCNLDCFYCHNRILLGAPRPDMQIAPEDVLKFLTQRVGLLDGIVISGGEPTLQPGLADFIRAVRTLGFGTKLDTNGARPDIVRELIAAGLLDYIAMDIKAPWDRYSEFAGPSTDIAPIRETAALLLENHVAYEFRTTAPPQLDGDDVLSIARQIQGARKYVLQQYRRPEDEVHHKDPRLETTPHPAQWFREQIDRIGPLVESCETRGVDD